jgi:hypothetical protein
MSKESQKAVDKMEKLNKLLADLKSGADVSAEMKELGAVQVQPSARIDIPLPPGWLSCDGCGCWCTSSQGAGHGCGEHAGHWA